MTNTKDPERRAFVRSENTHLGGFLNVDRLRSWSREYRCDCGFRCTTPGEIFDHSKECGRP